MREKKLVPYEAPSSYQGNKWLSTIEWYDQQSRSPATERKINNARHVLCACTHVQSMTHFKALLYRAQGLNHDGTGSKKMIGKEASPRKKL